MSSRSAQWFNAVVRDCQLNSRTFQLAQGNLVAGTDSSSMWNIFDAVPPDAFENYDPAQGNVFSSNYGAIISSLKPDALVTAALAAWNGAGGFPAIKAFNKTIANLRDGLTSAPGCRVVMDLHAQSADLTQAWAQAGAARPARLFQPLQPPTRNESAPQPSEDTVVEVSFTHLLTFAAGPLSKFDPLSPDLKDYTPWYLGAVLERALHDPQAWTDPTQWPLFFSAQQGSMLRCCASLVLVDGVVSVTRRANGAALAPGVDAGAGAAMGFWPFGTLSDQALARPRPLVAGDGSVTIESKVGNPLILGVNVQPLAQYLGTPVQALPSASVLVTNSGWFMARFAVAYRSNGQPVRQQSTQMSRGTAASIELPGGASDIVLTIEELVLPAPAQWSTVMVAHFDRAVSKSYEVYGTTLAAKWRES